MARAGLGVAITGGMALIVIASAVIGIGYRRGRDGPPGNRIFRDGLRSGPALCLGTPAGAVGSSRAQAGKGSGVVNAYTFLGGDSGVAGGALALALGDSPACRR